MLPEKRTRKLKLVGCAHFETSQAMNGEWQTCSTEAWRPSWEVIRYDFEVFVTEELPQSLASRNWLPHFENCNSRPPWVRESLGASGSFADHSP